MSLLTSFVQKATGKGLEVETLSQCLEKVEAMRESHGRSHQSLESLAGKFGDLLALVSDMETQQFEVLHRHLRKLTVLSGVRDHVSDFRQRVYWNILDHAPQLKQQYPSLLSFLSAQQEEYSEFKARRIRERPLNDLFYAAVQRLGLTRQEWLQLKVMGTDSVAAFHPKFTLEELKHEVFPPDLEPCRAVLVKAALKVTELDSAVQGSNAGALDDDDGGFA